MNENLIPGNDPITIPPVRMAVIVVNLMENRGGSTIVVEIILQFYKWVGH